MAQNDTMILINLNVAGSVDKLNSLVDQMDNCDLNENDQDASDSLGAPGNCIFSYLRKSRVVDPDPQGSALF